MNQDDTLKLAAEIVDKFSGPLREMTKSVHAFQDMMKGAHTEGSKGAKEQEERQKLLNERLKETGHTLTGIMTPAMAALGLSVGGAGASIGMLIEKLKGAGESFYKMQGAMARTGMAQGDLEAYSATIARVTKTSIDSAREQMATLGDTVRQIQRNYSPTIQALEGTFTNLHPLINKMAGESGAAAAKDFFEYYSNTQASPDQKRKLLRAFGLDPDIASATGEQFQEYLKEQLESFADHPPPSLKVAEQLDDAFSDLQMTLRELNDDFINAFGGSGAGMLTTLNDAILHNVEDLKQMKQDWVDFFTWLGSIKDKLGFQSGMEGVVPLPPSEKKPPWTAKGLPPLAPGFQRESFETGGGSGDAETTFSRGVERGTLRALQQWYAALTGGTTAGGGSSGIINASLGGSRAGAGGGSSGGLHSGGGYRVMPQGDTGGNLPGGGPHPAPGGADNAAGGGGDGGSGINRAKWLSQLNANPALKEELYRRSLGENTNPQANQAVMEEAANRADIRGNKSFGDHSNLSYFQGYHRGPISARQRAMLDANFDKVFRQGSDISKGAIDNSSQGLAWVHEHGGQMGGYGRPGLKPGRFRTTANFGGDGITGHPGVESFEVPGWGESGRGERDRYPEFRAGQQRDLLANAQAAGVGGVHRVEGDASLKVAFENAPAGAKAYMKYGGMFKSGTVDWGHAMPESNPGQ